MKIVDVLKNDKLSLSFEVFPPKTDSAFESVEEAASRIALDKVYESQGVDYSECYERYLAYDKILNI